MAMALAPPAQKCSGKGPAAGVRPGKRWTARARERERADGHRIDPDPALACRSHPSLPGKASAAPSVPAHPPQANSTVNPSRPLCCTLGAKVCSTGCEGGSSGGIRMHVNAGGIIAAVLDAGTMVSGTTAGRAPPASAHAPPRSWACACTSSSPTTAGAGPRAAGAPAQSSRCQWQPPCI